MLFAVAVFAAARNVCLGSGMRGFGAVSVANASRLRLGLLNPWIIAGIALLILFFASYRSLLFVAGGVGILAR